YYDSFSCLFFMIPRPPSPPLFPYTTLFRSRLAPPYRATGRRDSGERSRHRVPTLARGDPGQASRRPLGRCRGAGGGTVPGREPRSEEHTSELQSRENLVCRLLLEKKKEQNT